MLSNKLLLTLLLILVTVPTKAQKLYFSDTSNYWTFFCASSAPPGPPDPLYLAYWGYSGYQTINGVTYSELTNGTLVRDDTATGRVMMYLNDTTEVTLYDYSLQIGDTVSTDIQLTGYYNILLDVDTIYISDEPHVRQELQGVDASGNMWTPYEVIEGIGCKWDILYPLQPAAVENLCQLCSFINSDTQSVLYNGVYCALSVNDNKCNSNTKVYPSPAHNELTIENAGMDDKVSITLLDITGKALLQQKGSKGKNRLSLNNIPPGIYFIRIVSDNIRETHKVMIE